MSSLCDLQGCSGRERKVVVVAFLFLFLLLFFFLFVNNVEMCITHAVTITLQEYICHGNVGVDIIKKDKREPGTGRRLFVLRRTESKACEEGREEGVSRGAFCEERAEVDSDRPF